MMLAREKAQFCPGGRITEVECSTVNNIPSEATGETVDCNVYSGLTCLFVENAPIPCSDYKVRFFCDCEYYYTTHMLNTFNEYINSFLWYIFWTQI